MSTGTSGTSRARKPRKPAARRAPRQLTENLVKTICKLVEDGVPQGAAAGSVGVPRRTLQNWLAIGRAEDAPEPYRSFADRLQVSLDKFHASRAVVVAASTDDRTALQVLERRFKDDWGDPRRGDVNVHVNVQASPEWEALTRQIVEVLRVEHPDALRTLAERFGSFDPDAPTQRELPAAA